MENFTFWSPTKFVFGRGVESTAGENAKAFGCKKALVLYGRQSAVKSGLLNRVCASLAASSIEYTTLGGVQPNPLDDLVYKAIDICREHDIDFIIAVGGGSVIDTAKAVAAGVPYEGDFWDFFCGKSIVTDALPVGVVLTIPAAGSEGSGNSVITKQDGMIKISIRTESALRPKFALMNPELTYTLPPYQTAAGIVDMMAHILERYFTNTQGVEITDRVAEGCLMAIIDQAHRVMATPDDYDARANIMWSGTLAHNGVCGTGRVEDWSSHALEHELSAVYGVTHGAGLAVVMPAWMKYAAHINPARGEQFAIRVMHVEPQASPLDTALVGIDRLKEFFSSIGMPTNLAGLDITEPDIDLLVERLHRNKGTEFGGYIRITAEESRKIYQLMI